VLGHEINNSLTPIVSIAGSLRDRLGREPAAGSAGDFADDLERGLGVIAGRASALRRFMSAHTRLARLPSPHLGPLDVGAWVRRVVALETRMPIQVEEGPDVRIRADGDQLDQALINLVRNAVEAASETNGAVRVRWSGDAQGVEIVVEDEGPGLPDPENLFVPFFTTKPKGTGVGLVVTRQIAEAHGGSLRLESRGEGRGSLARLRLPAGPRPS